MQVSPSPLIAKASRTSPPTLSNLNRRQSSPQIWWSNAIFFMLVHVGAAVGVSYMPPWKTAKATLWLWFLTWQLADFGITIGYHRLFAHKAFRATVGVRIILAVLGSAAFQGSIKWWCLRHRLHHRFTDDPLHDPYAATRGLWHSHMGWIFFKPNYEKLDLIEKHDLDSDPVIRFQHRHYVSVAILCGFVAPTLLGGLWGDYLGAFIYGGLVARIFIWHCTFIVNSLAHWNGLQPYSDENSSRGNLILALLTGGEGNHNFHAFPYDFRSGPSKTDWDPSKWIILALHKLGWVHSLRRAHQEEITESVEYMHQKSAVGVYEGEPVWTGVDWLMDDIQAFLRDKPTKCLVLIDGYVIDATTYLREHPGGGALLRTYSMKKDDDMTAWKNASWAFNGGLNNHSRVAKKRMRELAIARLLLG